MNNNQYFDLLNTSHLGLRLGEEGVREFLDRCEIREISEGEILFMEGDRALGLFVVTYGEIKLSRLSYDGRETVLHTCLPGNMFAEAGVFLDKYPAMATAITDSELLFLPRSRILELIDLNGRFAGYLFETMSTWLKLLVARIELLTMNDGIARISQYLLNLHEKKPPEITKSAPRVTLPLRKGELAIMLNMHQASLSRILRRLQDQHIIEVRGRSILLHDLPSLRRYALPPLK